MKTAINKVRMTVQATQDAHIIIDVGVVEVAELAILGVDKRIFALKQRIVIKLPPFPRNSLRKDRLAIKCDLKDRTMRIIYMKNPIEIMIFPLPHYDHTKLVYAKIADIILSPTGNIGVINY